MASQSVQLRARGGVVCDPDADPDVVEGDAEGVPQVQGVLGDDEAGFENPIQVAGSRPAHLACRSAKIGHGSYLLGLLTF